MEKCDLGGPRVRLLEPGPPLHVGSCGWSGGLLTRDKDLEVPNGEEERGLVPRPLPLGIM